MVKRIAVVTGTRAEFGLLEPLLEKIVSSDETELQLIVTGMHLSSEFGMTVREVRGAGYHIADEIEMLLSSDSSVGVAKSVGLATIGFADSFRRLQPDWVVVLGDRFEILAAATTAMLMGVPIAHIHGGERTDGAIDDSIRHAVTKMARLHFVSTEDYRRRVIQLGESPKTVHHVGAIGLDRIDSQRLIPKEQLAHDLGLAPGLPWCTVTFHPVTTRPHETRHDVEQLTQAMAERRDLFFVITKANADENGRLVNRLLNDFVTSAGNAALFDSLGSLRYLSCVAASEFVLGNSSSGIIEAPFLGTPAVDIGLRQHGRISGPLVVHCEPDVEAIHAAIERARALRSQNVQARSPYYNGGASSRILKELRQTVYQGTKVFFDVSFDSIQV